MNDKPDNLDIPTFLKRTGNKVPVKSEEKMSGVAPESTKAKIAEAAKKLAAKAEKPAKAPAKVTPKAETDEYGYRAGSVKSKAAAMYATKTGATLAEVKTALNSTQLNLLKDLESRDFKVKRVKEAGSGKRQVTRYFLSK